MSINTSSSAFRKIDVDQYNEDNFGDEDQGELQSPPVGPDESEVTALLNQYPFIDKLKLFKELTTLFCGNFLIRNAIRLPLIVLIPYLCTI